MASSRSTVKLDFVTLDVFTDTAFVGNPLAVVLIPASKRALVSQEIKQRIAREFNLSETVFLHTLDNEPDTSVATREINIFLTTGELPFAGHPTIGSAYLVLRHLGWSHVDTLLTKAGPIRIEPVQETGGVMATIPHAVHIHKQTLGGVLGLLSDDAADQVRSGLPDDPEIRAAELAAPPVNIVKGMIFLLVRLSSLEQLARVSAKPIEFNDVTGLLDADEWKGGFVSRYHYVVTNESTAEDGSRKWAIRTRNVELPFEDPATGSAACALASFLTIREEAVHGATLAVTQGVEMGRQSEIALRTVAQKDETQVKIKELYMGGKAVVVMNGSISL